ncbi:MAG: transporter-associated protein EcsC, partial [Paenibacillus sp.]|nr:transporter-associated protein EcsC [Paenibacillus sp.]
MNSYEETVRAQLAQWERQLFKPPGFLERTGKTVQTKINEKIPAKVHQTITSAVKGIFHTVLFTLDFVPKGLPQTGLTLKQRDDKAAALVNTYKKIAAAEGAGTGASTLPLAGCIRSGKCFLRRPEITPSSSPFMRSLPAGSWKFSTPT